LRSGHAAAGRWNFSSSENSKFFETALGGDTLLDAVVERSAGPMNFGKHAFWPPARPGPKNEGRPLVARDSFRESTVRFFWFFFFDHVGITPLAKMDFWPGRHARDSFS